MAITELRYTGILKHRKYRIPIIPLPPVLNKYFMVTYISNEYLFRESTIKKVCKKNY